MEWKDYALLIPKFIPLKFNTMKDNKYDLKKMPGFNIKNSLRNIKYT